MMPARKLPVGIQSFEDLRANHYVYIDKTEYIEKLTESGKSYFLSRPRRFGKSLFLSALEAYFEGRKELFEGLKIRTWEDAKGENAWQSYPVIHFSLSGGDYHAAEGLARTLRTCLERCENRYGLEKTDKDLPNHFRVLIEKLYEKTGRQAVVLVEEYDKPLLETMEADETQEEQNRRCTRVFSVCSRTRTST